MFDRDNMLRRALADSLTEAGHVFYPRWKEWETRQAQELSFVLADSQWEQVDIISQNTPLLKNQLILMHKDSYLSNIIKYTYLSFCHSTCLYYTLIPIPNIYSLNCLLSYLPISFFYLIFK